MATIHPLCIPATEEPLLHRRIEFLWRSGNRANLPCLLFSMRYYPADDTGQETVIFCGWREDVTITGHHLTAVFEGIGDGSLNFLAETGAAEETPWPPSDNTNVPYIASMTLERREQK